jgi:energy-converting hydrogenase Eha subunit E
LENGNRESLKNESLKTIPWNAVIPKVSTATAAAVARRRLGAGAAQSTGAGARGDSGAVAAEGPLRNGATRTVPAAPASVSNDRSTGRKLFVWLVVLVGLPLIAVASLRNLPFLDFVAVAATVSPALIRAIRERYRQLDTAQSSR